MIKGLNYMHKHGMDCYINLIKFPIRLPDGSLILKVEWYNLGFTGNPWRLGLKQRIRLSPEQLQDWREIYPETERVL
jgi:hypothetical protein